jgi:transcriptional regulator with XRE-family HTH domain
VSSGLEHVEGDGDVPRFTDNFVRLLGLHALSQNFAAELIGVSGATVSSWMNGKSTPSLAKAVAVAELFQLSANRLIGAQFADLLEQELASRERFEQVEERIRRRRSSLRSV